MTLCVLRAHTVSRSSFVTIFIGSRKQVTTNLPFCQWHSGRRRRIGPWTALLALFSVACLTTCTSVFPHGVHRRGVCPELLVHFFDTLLPKRLVVGSLYVWRKQGVVVQSFVSKNETQVTCSCNAADFGCARTASFFVSKHLLARCLFTVAWRREGPSSSGAPYNRRTDWTIIEDMTSVCLAATDCCCTTDLQTPSVPHQLHSPRHGCPRTKLQWRNSALSDHGRQLRLPPAAYVFSRS